MAGRSAREQCGILFLVYDLVGLSIDQEFIDKVIIKTKTVSFRPNSILFKSSFKFRQFAMSDFNSNSSADDLIFLVHEETKVASIPTAALRSSSLEDVCVTLESAIMSKYNLKPEFFQSRVRDGISTIRILKEGVTITVTISIATL